MQGDQISNTSIYSEQIHISTNHNILEQFIPTFNFVISSSDKELLDLFVDASHHTVHSIASCMYI